jgi:hypothetical protein
MMRTEAQREILYWTVVVGATGVPWMLGWVINWWLGLVVLALLCWLYDRLFVSPDALCMGIPFMVPMASGLAYVGWGGVLLVRWLNG